MQDPFATVKFDGKNLHSKTFARGLIATLVLVSALSACGGGGGPPPEPTVKLTASATAVPLGGSLNLLWQSTDAAACLASGAWAGAQPSNGQLTWAPPAPGSYTFKLACTGEGGTGSATTTVEVLAPPSVAVNVNPGQVRVNESATLAWTSSGSSTCAASGAWTGAQTATGNQAVSQTTAGSFNYSLQCSGPGGSVTSQATLQVLPARPTVALTVDPASTVVGQSGTLSWSSSNATGCVASGAWTGSVTTSGTLSVTAASAGSTSYGLTCSGPGGDATASTTLQVAAPPAPTVSVSATPASVAFGGASSLSWSSTNANSCTATGGWTGARATAGSVSVNPTAAGSNVYGLTCTGAGGTSSATTSVDMLPPTPAVAITATPTSVVLGQSTVLNWSTTNASNCTATGGWSGAQAVLGTATVAPSAVGSASYGLQCTGPGGSGSGSATVTVTAPAPTLSLSLSPSTVQRGQFFSIVWASTNATSCVPGDAFAGSVIGLNGNLPGAVSTAGSSVYSITCTGPGGSVTQRATLTVTP